MYLQISRSIVIPFLSTVNLPSNLTYSTSNVDQNLASSEEHARVLGVHWYFFMFNEVPLANLKKYNMFVVTCNNGEMRGTERASVKNMDIPNPHASGMPRVFKVAVVSIIPAGPE